MGENSGPSPCATDVVILCGGLGTRLRAVINDGPKPMADIAGRPFLFRLIDHLAGFGFKRFVLSAGYKAELIEERISEVAGQVEVSVIREPRPLGTGGALREARGALTGKMAIVMNGDSFCPVNYPALLDLHAARRASATIVVVRSHGASDVGSVRRGEGGAVTGFLEKEPSGEGWVNAGIYVFEAATIGRLPESTPLSLERDVFPGLAGKGLYSFEASGPLVDIGTPERYADACRTLPKLMEALLGTGRLRD